MIQNSAPCLKVYLHETRILRHAAL
jgi:hypothetical protein